MVTHKNILPIKSLSLSSLPSSYQVPRHYIDCQKIIKLKLFGPSLNAKPELKTQQKLKFKKNFFIDEKIKAFKNLPGPQDYTEKYSLSKKYKSQKTIITSPNKKFANLPKRPTWIEDIQTSLKKNPIPTATQYNFQKQSDFFITKKDLSLQNLHKNRFKFNNFDENIYISAQIPGPGAYNPKKNIPKLRTNMMNPNMWIKKHQKEKRIKIKKLDSSNTSSFSYSPIKDKTFDSIYKQPKKDSTLMKLTHIDKRHGLVQKNRLPGPGSYDVVNRWAAKTFQKQKNIKNINLFSKTTRGLSSLRIYY